MAKDFAQAAKLAGIPVPFSNVEVEKLIAPHRRRSSLPRGKLAENVFMFSNLDPPPIIEQIGEATKSIGFELASEPLTGSLLRTLAASKAAGRFLELGTGTGIGTAWLLAGMDLQSSLISVESDGKFLDVAIRQLSSDPRATFHLDDAAKLIGTLPKKSFDLIFADTWAGKYTHLDETLELLKPGGIYVIDDMLPQPTWLEDHPPKAERLIADLERRKDLVLTKLNWASGIVIAVRRCGD